MGYYGSLDPSAPLRLPVKPSPTAHPPARLASCQENNVLLVTVICDGRIAEAGSLITKHLAGSVRDGHGIVAEFMALLAVPSGETAD